MLYKIFQIYRGRIYPKSGRRYKILLGNPGEELNA
jgi:hypothetical protein